VLSADYVSLPRCTDITALANQYEHDREDGLRIVGKLAQLAAAAPGEDKVVDVVTGSAGVWRSTQRPSLIRKVLVIASPYAGPASRPLG
jgi:hypothetical protein